MICTAVFDAAIQILWKKNWSPKVSIIELLILLLVAGICGGLGQALAGYSPGGCLVTIAVGFIGALLGTWLARVMELPELVPLSVGGHSFPIVWSIIGGALFSAILSLLTRRAPLE